MKRITFACVFFSWCVWAGAQNIPPCTLEITDAGIFADEWTVIDNNQSESPQTWIYSDEGAWYEQDTGNAADDWVVSPAVTLEAGKAYKVSAYVKHASTSFFDSQKIELMIGREATVEALSTRLFVDESFQSRLFVEVSGVFSPGESGTYYIGLHCYSSAYMGDLYLQKIEVDEAPVYPAQIADLAVTAGEEGVLSAHLSWTWPTTDQYGGPLENLSGARIYRGDDELATLDEATPGAPAEWTDTSIERAGVYRYRVVAYNTFGDAPGEAATVPSPWIGNDTPLAVTNLRAEANGATVLLTFDPPVEGENGGYINPEAMTYQIERTPGGVVAESFSGPQPFVDEVSELGGYTYTVTAVFDGESSQSATSNRVIAGGAKETPYSETFDSESALELFTVIDGNNDGRTWSYYKSKALVQYWGGNVADEWFIMPRMNLQAGKNYKLMFEAGLENAASEEHYKDLQVTIGRQATAEAQTVQLYRDTIESALMEKKEVIFTVDESGVYYIGFHCLGATSIYAIFIDDIELDETAIVPAEVSDLVVTPGEQGALLATVTWTNPSLSAAGTPLPFLTKMELYRGETLVDTQLDPEMGASARFVDESIPSAGKYVYKLIGYVGGDTGEAATVESGWIGRDVPLSVTDVVLTDADGQPRIDFKAPDGGVNGGYVDVESFTYRVVRNPGDEILTEELTDTCYVDADNLALALYRYTVTVLWDEVESEPATSNALIFGGALELPYETDMATDDEMALWTVVDANNDDKSWVYTSGEMAYNSYSTADDWLFTPPFESVKGSHTLKFRARANSYRYPESMEVTLGREAVPGEGQQVIVSYPEIKSTLAELYSTDFEIPDEGTWYIGFHIISPDPWGLYLNYCSIECNVISGIGAANQSASLYYRPESQSLYLGATGHLEIVDVRGVTVVARQSVSGSLDVSQLPAGLYIARWVAEGEKPVQIKFIK